MSTESLHVITVACEVVDAHVGQGVAGGAEEHEDGDERQHLRHAAHQNNPGPEIKNMAKNIFCLKGQGHEI